MQFNDETTKQGILQDIDFLCNTNSATYPVEEKTRNVNRWYHFCVAEILDAMDEWDFQGDKAYTDLVASQQNYSWPSEILKIKRVEVDYDGDGEYVLADPFDAGSFDKTIATSAEINDYFSTDDPKYDAYGDELFLYPVPDTAVNSGLIIWYTKNVNEFTAMATGWPTNMVGNSAEPAFAEPFHRILSLGASLDYARKHQISDLVAFCERELYGTVATRKGRVGGLIDKLRKFYSTRSADKILSMKSRYYDENYK
mgnify:CR=1 FL=1